MQYVIYTDESISRGEYFSNFYGGALVRSTDLERTEAQLLARKEELGLTSEVKWQRVRSHYLDRYIHLMDLFMDLVARDQVKMRVMFTQNLHAPVGLLPEHRANEYPILYYQFLKHAFGLRYSNDSDEVISLRIYPDQMPATEEQKASFRGHLVALTQSAAFRDAKLRLQPDHIIEVNSENHMLLQCLDVVLGSMQFMLNHKHKAKPPGARIRAKTTRAKEKVYKHLLGRIRELHPNFNIGITTGHLGDPANRWRQPYRHWLFMPSKRRRDESFLKPEKVARKETPRSR